MPGDMSTLLSHLVSIAFSNCFPTIFTSNFQHSLLESVMSVDLDCFSTRDCRGSIGADL